MKQRLNRHERVLLALALAILAFPLYAQSSRLEANDPVFGTWVLDLQRSMFAGRPAPRSQTRIYEPHPEGLKGTVITVAGDGSESKSEFVYRYDGIDYPFAGRPGADAIALERTGRYTAVSTFFHAGRPVGNALRTISADGKELTIRVEFQGNVTSIEVFRKQE
jgi:hypothetical protein